jgi:hypothetical protein
MEIDNDKRASRAKMLLISLPFVLLLAGSVPALFLWIDTWIPTLVAGSLVILGWAATVILKLTSVKFRFSDEAISVLYYPISPMTSNYKRIDIDSDKLLKYEIRISWGGLKKDLILYEKIGGEEASYPPVSITLCKKNLILEIEENLSAYCSKGTNS